MSDMEVIDSYLGGDASSHALVDSWIEEVLRHRAFGIGDERRDLAQNVRRKLTIAFRSGRFRAECSLRTFVWRITQYTLIDYFRARPRAVGDMDETESLVSMEPNPEEALAAKERQERFQRLLGSLSGDCRKLFSLAVFEERPYGEIAALTGVSEGALRVRMLRCREKAREAYRTHVTGGAPARLLEVNG
jgi:RNA polymerase sigma-70 factor (ECF subfamily)